MLKLVINSHKGGAGKTMLCALLAVEAERVGDGPVWLIDTDPQETLSEWHTTRAAAVPARAKLIGGDIAGLEATIAAVEREGARYVIIDTQAGRRESMEPVFALADLVLVPIQPAPSDLWATAKTIGILQRDDRRFLFIVNRIKVNTRLSFQVTAELSHHGPVAAVALVDREDYKTAFIDGRTAPELKPKGPAAKEIAALWVNIQKMLTNTRKRKEA